MCAVMVSKPHAGFCQPVPYFTHAADVSGPSSRTYTSVEKRCVYCLAVYVWPQVFLADPFQSFTSQGDWGTRLMSTDGLHLSKAGNDEVWNIFYNAINDKMQLT